MTLGQVPSQERGSPLEPTESAAATHLPVEAPDWRVYRRPRFRTVLELVAERRRRRWQSLVVPVGTVVLASFLASPCVVRELSMILGFAIFDYVVYTVAVLAAVNRSLYWNRRQDFIEELQLAGFSEPEFPQLVLGENLAIWRDAILLHIPLAVVFAIAGWVLFGGRVSLDLGLAALLVARGFGALVEAQFTYLSVMMAHSLSAHLISIRGRNPTSGIVEAASMAFLCCIVLTIVGIFVAIPFILLYSCILEALSSLPGLPVSMLGVTLIILCPLAMVCVFKYLATIHRLHYLSLTPLPPLGEGVVD